MKGLDIHVGGERVSITRMDVKQGHDIYFHVCEIELPALPANAAKSWTVISFAVSFTERTVGDGGIRAREYRISSDFAARLDYAKLL